MSRTPHFLRVVQALAFVSGIAPIAGFSAGCSSTGRVQGEEALQRSDDSGTDPVGWPMGSVVGPDYDGAAPPPEVYDGQVTGLLPDPYDGQVVGVIPYDGQVVGVIPYDGQVFGTFPPPDAGLPDATLVGGPLSPPELPSSLAPEAMV